MELIEDHEHKLVRSAVDGEGLETWHKHSQELDLVANMRRRIISSLVQGPSTVEDGNYLGPALEDW